MISHYTTRAGAVHRNLVSVLRLSKRESHTGGIFILAYQENRLL